MSVVGFLGPAGTFTDIALDTYLDNIGMSVSKKPFSTFSDCFLALFSGDIQYLFIPIENSLGGEVVSVLEELVHIQEHVSITAEIQMKIVQSLMVVKGVDVGDISDIYSHEQSLMQCRSFLKSQYPQASFHSCSSNAVAAQSLLDLKEKSSSACIGPKKLTKLYDLEVLKEKVNDYEDNETRFVMLSNEKTEPTGQDKTSFIFSTFKDQPGSLCNILQEMSSRGINLTRITSRPSKKMMGDYLFYIDCMGHYEETVLKECLEKIASNSSFYKFLGSYKEGAIYA
ncbi:prephenate dehydratase [Candidatus Marinamargulisbacteria bacterium SCGC AG-343-D04]|nr:prephenate dehydratase [Candidatus Marinamargulisbacteria bacterium SCGC AG-343-D04]